MRRFVTAVAGASVALLMVSSAPTATADTPTEGLWYFDLPGIQAIHDSGITGEGVTIAVIDGQINLEVPTLQGADIDVQPSLCWDEDGSVIPTVSTNVFATHGTNIVSYLVGTGAGYPGQTGVKGIVPDAKILYFGTGRDLDDLTNFCNTEAGQPAFGGDQEDPLGEAIFRAVDAGVDVISISLGGQIHDYIKLAVTHALHAGIPVVASLSNELDLSNFPAAYNGVVGVAGGDENALPLHPEGSLGTDVIAPGSNLLFQGGSAWEEQSTQRGNSFATPMVAGYLALVAQKYPDATGNQLIQTLIHNTGLDDHELAFDATGVYGFGTASASHMLRVDPTQYDDVNPLINDDPGSIPTRAEIENPIDQADWKTWEIVDPPSGENAGDNPSQQAEVNIGPLLAILGGILLLVALVVTLIIVLATRRARATRTTPPA
jgi:subtilisin family serine protease